MDGSPHFKESVCGIVRFDEMGRTIWKPDQSGQDCFVELTQEEKVIADMEVLLMTPPRGLRQTYVEG